LDYQRRTAGINLASAGRVDSVILNGIEVSGTWRHSSKGRQMTIQLFPFREISKNELRQIQEKAEKLAKFLKKELLGIAG
jgi:hypothetical protein